MAFFEKYGELQGRPNGRPVGVANGQGQQSMTFENPMLKGMAMTQSPVATSARPAPAAGGEKKSALPAPPQYTQGQVTTLMDWVKKYGGGR